MDCVMDDARPLKRAHVEDPMDIDEPFMSSSFNFVAHAPATPPMWAAKTLDPAPDALFSRLRVASPPARPAAQRSGASGAIVVGAARPRRDVVAVAQGCAGVARAGSAAGADRRRTDGGKEETTG